MKSILKQILKFGRFCLSQPIPEIPVQPFSVLVSVLQQFEPSFTSSKSISLVQTFFSELKDTLKKLKETKELNPRVLTLSIELSFSLLSILQLGENLGKKDLMSFVLIPCVQFVSDNLKNSAQFHQVAIYINFTR